MASLTGGIKLAPLLVDIQTDIATFKSDMSRASAIGVTEANKISQELATTTKVGEKLAGIGNKLTLGLTVPLVGAGLATGKLAMDFESSFAKVSTLLDSNVVDFDTYKRQLLDASDVSKIAVGEFSDAVYEAISAGVDQTKAIGFTTGAMKLAKGGFTTGAKAVDVMTTAINGYKLKTEDATRISDLLIVTQNIGKTTVDELASSMGTVIPIASAANYGIEELGTAFALMTKNGIATSEAGTYVKSMLSELTQSGSATDKVLRELSGKGFADLKKEGKSTTEIFSILNTYALKNNITLKDMFGSVEAGSAAMVLASGDGKEYNDILTQMGNSAGSTQDAFEKIDATPAEKLNGALNKMKNSGIKMGASLVPIINKVSEVISILADKFNNLTDEQRESILKWGAVALAIGPVFKIVGGGIKVFTTLKPLIVGVGRALGVFRAAAVVAVPAVEGVGVAAGAGATGLGALTGGLGSAAIAAAPFALAIAGVSLVAYGVHKALSKEVIPTVDLYADTIYKAANGTFESVTKISASTKTAVGAYMEMDTNVQKSLLNMKFNNTTVTQEVVTDLTTKYSNMGKAITAELDKDYNANYGVLQKFFSESSTLTTEEQSNMMLQLQTHYTNEKINTQTALTEIQTILTTASNEKRGLKTEEYTRINELNNGMKTSAVKALSDTEKESVAILARIKDSDGRLTAETAAEHVKALEGQRVKTIEQAEIEYQERLRVAEAIRSEGGTKAEEAAEKCIAAAELQRKETIEKAKQTKTEGIDVLSQSYTDLENNVDTKTGKILDWWGSLKKWYDGWKPDFSNYGPQAPQYDASGNYGNHAYNGLSYVPTDGFKATLHKGERVLTSEENKAMTQGNSGSNDVSQTLNFYGRVDSPYDVAKASRKAFRDVRFA